MKTQNKKNKQKKQKSQKNQKLSVNEPKTQVFKKKAPRRKVKVDITINFDAFKGNSQGFKIFS
jgi:hypothetical protein